MLNDNRRQKRGLGKGLPSLLGPKKQIQKIAIERPNLWRSWEEESRDIFKVIEKYLVNRYGKNIRSTYENNRFFYEKHNEVDVMIRYRPYGYNEFTNCIVISRIFFKNTREGSGTQFLNFLCEISKKFGLSHIVIESVNSNSRAFATSLGFTNSRTEDVLAAKVLVLKKKIDQNTVN